MTILGATAEDADLPAGSLPSCASFSLSAFCCDEMDLPDCDYGTSASDCVVGYELVRCMLCAMIRNLPTAMLSCTSFHEHKLSNWFQRQYFLQSDHRLSFAHASLVI